MIGTSAHEYVFIRTCIVGLRAITPLSILYCVALPFLPRQPPLFVSVWPVAEAAFYLFVYLPRRWILQRPAVHPLPLPSHERKQLFDRGVRHISDPEEYFVKWFKDAPLSEIKRENVKEFYRWAFLDTGDYDATDDEELDEYVRKYEETHGLKIEPGYGNAKCLRLTLDPVDMVHRSLAWYLIVFVVDSTTHLSLLYHGFRYHRTSLLHFATVFPPRPLTLFTTKTSPVRMLSYWHRPHTSTSKLPIVFLHGIGIGLWPYVKFLAALNNQGPHDEDVGIIAIELLPISFRITQAALGQEEVCRQIGNILHHHGYEKFVLVTHSYGAIIATRLLKHPVMSPQIASVVLVDPVTILLHLPDVAYNFTYRKPRRANEWQLWYFASKDMSVAHTLHRTFFWSQNILWKEDLSDKSVTVFLGGRDLIVNTEEVGKYLTGTDNGDWKRDEGVWTAPDGRLKVVWCGELDHAQIFDSKARMRVLVDEVLRRSSAGRGEEAFS